MRNPVQALQNLLHIGRKIERVGDQDVIEAFAEIQVLGRLDVEFGVGDAEPRLFNSLFRGSMPTLRLALRPARRLPVPQPMSSTEESGGTRRP
jgi:hypothetical protein